MNLEQMQILDIIIKPDTTYFLNMKTGILYNKPEETALVDVYKELGMYNFPWSYFARRGCEIKVYSGYEHESTLDKLI